MGARINIVVFAIAFIVVRSPPLLPELKFLKERTRGARLSFISLQNLRQQVAAILYMTLQHKKTRWTVYPAGFVQALTKLKT